MLGEATDTATRAEIMTHLASFSLRRKFDESHAILDETLSLIDDSMPVVRVRYLLERGRIYNSSVRLMSPARFFSKHIILPNNMPPSA